MPYDDHKGCLKIGETTCDDDTRDFTPNSKDLNRAARRRIDEYTKTAGVRYDLLYTEYTVFTRNGKVCSFNDKEVHNVLERSGYKRKEFDNYNKYNKPQEWFCVDLDTVKAAISAVKDGRESIGNRTTTPVGITFRLEQREAIDMAVRLFRRKDKEVHSVLWNAKMRFGKTLCALQVVKEAGFAKTLILTHRPVVNEGWFDDFRKIFSPDDGYRYGSRNRGDTLSSLIDANRRGGIKFVFFASMQDLRGSEQVGGNFDKNDEIFAMEWDLLIIDEAHEGTQTELGKAVTTELRKEDTRTLALSGTPFNLLESNEYSDDNIFTWDYQMEQKAKREWDFTRPGDPNPYASLPAMNIYTYNLGALLRDFVDEDVAFNFREFFRTDDACRLVHEKDVRAFLDLLTKEDPDSCYPFANANYRNIFRHTLWVLPGVKAARALGEMLRGHNVFQYFDIVNVAGNGDEEEESADTLEKVQQRIGGDPSKTRTITLTCGRLTTGVSVPAWTAVLMLSGSYSTAAMGYMQTIFRVQTPATIGGMRKTECYVFDFAPDRTLRVVTEAVKVSSKAGKASDDDRKILGDFLNFCPVIGISGSQMTPYDANSLLTQLKRDYVERVVRSGFEDRSLYNNQLMKLNDIELQDFDKLKKVVGTTKAHKTKDIDINRQGLTDEEYEELEKLKKRDKKNAKEPLSPEEKKRIEELKAKRKNRDAAISILRGISIRMPLLIYGAENIDNEDELTIDKFADLVDPLSWEVFMPRGVDKATFNKFKRYYDPEIFTGAAKRIRAMARAADNLCIEKRIERITDIFATFHNPDKETVLTPWRVVNMHMGDTIGGWCFYDKDYKTRLQEPRFIDHGEVTANVFNHDSRILEINSKTGLYPLYVAYSLYRARLKEQTTAVATIEQQQRVWDQVVSECVFVVCMSPMAKSITKRTLVGFRKAKVNTRYFENLINQIKNKPDNFIQKMAQGRSFWKANNDDNMKYNAIVGNPPYQVMDGGGTGSSAVPVYHFFVEMAKSISPSYISLIMPSRWMTGGKGLDTFREIMLNDKQIRVMHDYMNSHECFPNVEIEGGICYFLWCKGEEDLCTFVSHTQDTTSTTQRYLSGEDMDIVIRDAGSLSILNKVQVTNSNFSSLVSTRNLFKVNTSQLTTTPTTPADKCIRVFGRYNGERGFRYLPDYSTEDKHAQQFIGRWKVFVSKADGAAGQIGNPIPARIIGKVEYGDRMSICTETFLAIGPFNSEIEARNVIIYARTKFFRFLVGIRKLKNMTQDTYIFVPLQDFSSYSDIDWSVSVDAIDRQLYDKYGLTDEERAFIERMIKPME